MIKPCDFTDHMPFLLLCTLIISSNLNSECPHCKVFLNHVGRLDCCTDVQLFLMALEGDVFFFFFGDYWQILWMDSWLREESQECSLSSQQGDSQATMLMCWGRYSRNAGGLPESQQCVQLPANQSTKPWCGCLNLPLRWLMKPPARLMALSPATGMSWYWINMP